MKRKKIKWGNLFKLIVFVFCIGIIIHDFYMLTLYSFITGIYASWTMWGFISFSIAVCISCGIYDDFKEQIENIPSYQPKHARDIKNK